VHRAKKHHKKKAEVKKTPTAGEPEIDPEPTITHLGAGGLPQTSTTWGPLIYPLDAKDLGGASPKKLNRATEDLIDQMKDTDQEYLKVKHRAAGSLYPAEMFEDKVQGLKASALGGEIADNLDDKGAEEAQKITDVQLQKQHIQISLRQAQIALDDGRSKLKSALRLVHASKSRTRAKELQDQIDKIDKTFGVVKELGDTAMEVAFDPEKAAEALAKCVVDLSFDLANDEAKKQYEEERDEALAEAEEDQLQAAEDDEETAKQDIGSAKSILHDLQGLLMDSTDVLDTRSRAAEKHYDQHTKGDFKFGELRKQADSAADDANSADQAAREAQAIWHRLNPVRDGLSDVILQHAGAPEVFEEYQTLGAITSRAAKEQEELEGIAAKLNGIAGTINAKLGELDATLASAGERHEPTKK
jgi:hypothetical protein